MNFSLKAMSLTAIVALSSLSTFAIPTLKITDQANNSVTFTDASGVVNGSTTALAGWNIVFGTGFTAPIIGSASVPQFQLTGSAIRTAASEGTLKFEFFDTIFTQNPFMANLTGSVTGGTAQGEITYSSQLENSPYLTSAVLSYGFVNSNASANLVGVPDVPSVTPYSAGLVTHLKVFAGSGVRSVGFSTALSAVPEPGFYGALALGLSGLFAAFARRRSSVKE